MGDLSILVTTTLPSEGVKIFPFNLIEDTCEAVITKVPIIAKNIIIVINTVNFGFALDFTASYFLVGFGIDWIIITHEQTTTTNLINSGFTGNFTKVSTMSLSGSRRNLFLDLGFYFKYFSVSSSI